MLIVPFALGCSGPVTLDGEPTQSTYHGDVRPLVETHCVSCHTEGAIGPFVLDDMDAIGPLGPQIVDAVVDRRMPPWGMDPSCRETVGSLWLSDDDVATFVDWADNGYAMGAPADYEAPEPIPAPAAERPPDLVFQPEQTYTPLPGGADDYRCFAVSDPLPQQVFVEGVRVTPGVTELVHHVIVYAVPPAGLAALDAIEAQDPEPGYVCFGDAGLADATTLGGWVPGQVDGLYPSGLAGRIPAGSRLVMQMHYNSAAQPDTPMADRSSVDLWTLPAGQEPDDLLVVYPAIKLGIDVPANAAASEQVAVQRVPVLDAAIMATHPHMHLLGSSLSTTLVRPDGQRVCLSQVDQWDFDWQRTYASEREEWIEMSVEDELELRCTYDNSASDQPVAWGSGTDDEMCLDYLGIVVPWEGGVGEGVCAAYPVCAERCAPDDPMCHISCLTASGDSCMFCGLGGVVSQCVGLQCPLPGLSLQACIGQCSPDGHFEELIHCLHGECADEFDAYWSCAGPVLQEGSCADEFAACPEILRSPTDG